MALQHAEEECVMQENSEKHNGNTEQRREPRKEQREEQREEKAENVSVFLKSADSDDETNGTPDAHLSPAKKPSCQGVQCLFSYNDTEIIDCKPEIRRLIWHIILIPVFFSVFLWLFGTFATKHSSMNIPNSLDVYAWRNFSLHVKESVKTIDTHYPNNVLLVLLCCHALQLLFSFPLIHVTKMMYGYFFGLVWGAVMCCVWELFLVCVLITVTTQNSESKHRPIKKASSDLGAFLHHVNTLRSKGRLFPFLLAIHASSVPLVTATCLVLFQIVGQWEFICSHAIVTVFMTLKDTWLGDFLASSDGNATNIAIAATMLSLSALLPAGIAVILMSTVSSTVNVA